LSRVHLASRTPLAASVAQRTRLATTGFETFVASAARQFGKNLAERRSAPNSPADST
jgi:hypothetical protein